MDTKYEDIPLVQKEVINELTFPLTDVLSGRDKIQERLFALHRATSLGNLSKHKVNIIFEDEEGMKQVRTTIWAISDKKIVLKAGRTIPVSRIHEVVIG